MITLLRSTTLTVKGTLRASQMPITIIIDIPKQKFFVEIAYKYCSTGYFVGLYIEEDSVILEESMNDEQKNSAFIRTRRIVYAL